MAKAPTDLRSLARSHGATAIKVLAEIMSDPSAPPSARAQAATQILNRGYGMLVDAERFIPDQREYYVYSIHDRSGRLIYIGKGCGRRGHQSAVKLSGRHRVRAKFTSEKQALAFEARLIKRFNPPFNIVHNEQRLRA